MSERAQHTLSITIGDYATDCTSVSARHHDLDEVIRTLVSMQPRIDSAVVRGVYVCVCFTPAAVTMPASVDTTDDEPASTTRHDVGSPHPD